LPQECIAMHSLTFTSYQFRVTFPVRGYFEWLRANGIAGAYRTQHWTLQHLQSAYAGQQWLLKSPGNLMWLDQLLAEFPAALIIHTHRDPAKVLGSVSSLYATFYNAASDHVDPYEIGRDQFAEWSWGLERAMAAREALPADRVVDVAFEDTLRDPVGVISRIYEHFGLEMTPQVAQAAREYLAANSRDKHGVHTYSLTDFGLDRDEVDEAFAAYRQRFHVPREG
jgi:hypothetical protein